MSSDYEFTMPWPPSINTLRACVRNRLITSKKGREYFNSVEVFMRELGLYDEGINERVSISLVMHPPTLRRYDCSNFLKAYEDALVKCNFIIDDHLIEYGSIRKGEKKAGGALKVKVNIIS